MSCSAAAPVSLRPLVAADLDATQAIEEAGAVVPWSRQNFLDSLKAGYSGWAAVAGEAADAPLLGFAFLMVSVDEGHLLNIGVAPSQQGRGIGRLLLAQIAGRAWQAGCLKLFLEVRPGNARALDLYRRAGFVEVGRRKNYYPAPALPGGREDALVLALALSPAVLSALSAAAPQPLPCGAAGNLQGMA